MAETLQKIEYTTLQQFLEDLNANMAIIQNSPLFKGVIGKTGDAGSDGSDGIRGTHFMFVNFTKFNEQFPTEIFKPSDVTLEFLNIKIATPANKAKVLIALNESILINNDVIVLTSSAMLLFNAVDARLYDTGIAFNDQINLIANLEKTIEESVNLYLNNWSNSQENTNVPLIEKYTTIAKNFTGSDNIPPSNTLTPNAVFVPLYTGYTTSAGVTIDSHKYFGFTDASVPLTNGETFVYGSTKKYIELLLATTDPNSLNGGLSSDYAPGVGNIPNLILMQETDKNGLMFGRKAAATLHEFGSIYKDVDNYLIIKSHQSQIASEFSAIKLTKTYLEYSKNVIIGNDLTFVGSVNNKFLRSAHFINNDVLQNDNIEIGALAVNAKTIFASDKINFKKFANRILTTDSNGDITSTAYSLEDTTIDIAKKQFLNKFGSTNVPSASSKLITSNYFKFLAEKFDNTTDYIVDNFWTKTNFSASPATIPNLRLSNLLSVEGNVQLGNSQSGYLFELLPLSLNINLGKNSSTTNVAGFVNYKTLLPPQLKYQFDLLQQAISGDANNKTVTITDGSNNTMDFDDFVIMRGCQITKNNDEYTITSGIILYQGLLYKTDAATITPSNIFNGISYIIASIENDINIGSGYDYFTKKVVFRNTLGVQSLDDFNIRISEYKNFRRYAVEETYEEVITDTYSGGEVYLYLRRNGKKLSISGRILLNFASTNNYNDLILSTSIRPSYNNIDVNDKWYFWINFEGTPIQLFLNAVGEMRFAQNTNILAGYSPSVISINAIFEY